MEDKRLTLEQVKELQSKWMDGGCPGSLIDFLKSAGAFKPEPLADGLYVCRLDGFDEDRYVFDRRKGKWRYFASGSEVPDYYPFTIAPYARLTETPI